MARRIQFRRGTAADWATPNPVLSAGEPGFEADTGALKIGDGATTWSALSKLLRKSDADALYAPAGAGFALSFAAVATSETSASTAYGDLPTVGPSVTVTIKASGLALVTIGAAMVNTVAGAETLMHLALTGATTRAAANIDSENFSYNADVANGVHRGSRTFVMSSLNPGATTFTAKYRVGAGGGTGTWAGRQIIVIPL